MVRDLSGCSYEEWLDFVFSHFDQLMDWHLEEKWEYTCDANTLISHMIRLFSNPDVLFDYYTWMEVESGFWFLPGPNGFMWALLSNDVSLEKRKECICLMKNLFLTVFPEIQGETAGYMWWESVMLYCHLGTRDITEPEVLEVVVATINEVHAMGNESAKLSAEHGIRHFRKMAKSLKSQEVKVSIDFDNMGR